MIIRDYLNARKVDRLKRKQSKELSRINTALNRLKIDYLTASAIINAQK